MKRFMLIFLSFIYVNVTFAQQDTLIPFGPRDTEDNNQNFNLVKNVIGDLHFIERENSSEYGEIRSTRKGPVRIGLWVMKNEQQIIRLAYYNRKGKRVWEMDCAKE